MNFIWKEESNNHYISLGYLGSIRLELQPGEGYSVIYNNCMQLDRPTKINAEGMFLESPVPKYYIDLEEAKLAGLYWAASIINTSIQEFEEFILEQSLKI